MDMAKPMCVRASIRDMKKLRSGSMLAAAVEDWQADPITPPSRKVIKNVVHIDEETRRRNWRLLGPILKIQRWHRRIISKRNVAQLLEKRRQFHNDIWRATAAESIQRAWRGCVARRRATSMFLAP
eukprot:TRINITY_DN7457_c1_g1_i1.p1 TRINITY_DN7457_c1_g1~~TRINITY_DN7457_c1_g1_i1.p1  ORF type:complete len:126 (+),score=16.16 TRINITY_DN7457_c1_g1_i1:26-403(+)